jgi:hypothetical protein
MQYLVLIYSEDGVGPQSDTPEFGAYMQGFAEANKAYEAAGVMRGGNALQHSSTATTVRIRGGKVETMDGPFAETKERLGGYYVLDCKDLDEAIRMAALIPTAEFGSIEVRPIWDVEV